MPESWRKVRPASAFFTGSQLLQSGISLPASGSVRYRWSQISPALPSMILMAVLLSAQVKIFFSRKNVFYQGVLQSSNQEMFWRLGCPA
jgi:hypothetical protein